MTRENRAVGRPMRWASLVVTFVVLGAGCGSSDPPSGDAARTTPTAPASGPFAPTGVASRFEQLPPPKNDNEERPKPLAPPAGRLVLRGCRWRGPARTTYDLEWSSPNAHYPVTFTLGLERLRDDMGAGSAGNVTLTAAGRFSVTDDDELNQKVFRIREDEGSDTGRVSWEAARDDQEDQLGVGCYVDVG